MVEDTEYNEVSGLQPAELPSAFFRKANANEEYGAKHSVFKAYIDACTSRLDLLRRELYDKFGMQGVSQDAMGDEACLHLGCWGSLNAPLELMKIGDYINAGGTSLHEGANVPAKYHRGVRLTKNGKYAVRLNLPAGSLAGVQNRRAELGEYKTFEKAVIVSRIGARLLGKPPDKAFPPTPEEEEAFKKLSPVPNDRSDKEKLTWIIDTARDCSSKSPYRHDPKSTTLEQPGAAGCSYFVSSPPTDGMCGRAIPDAGVQGAEVQSGPTFQQPDAGGCGSFVNAHPNDIPFDGYNFDTTLPNTTVQSSLFSYDQSQRVDTITPPNTLSDEAWNKYIKSGSERRSETPDSSVKLQVVDGIPRDQVPPSEPRRTDSTVSASRGPRKRTTSASELYELVLTDDITRALSELRKQGWEVRLKRTKHDNSKRLQMVK